MGSLVYRTDLPTGKAMTSQVAGALKKIANDGNSG